MAWAQQTTPTSDNNKWNNLCWSPDLALFVAVGTQNSGSSTNRVMTSPDGATWTIRAAATAVNWQSVTWASALSLFVAVGVTNSVMTSPDGITWTIRSGPDANTNNSWNNVIWSPDLTLFVAFSGAGSGTSPATTFDMMTSPDGVTWTGHAVHANGWNTARGVWVSSLSSFIVAQSDSIVNGATHVYTSLDGTTWTLRFTVPLGSLPFATHWMAWDAVDGVAAAVLGSADNPIYTSPDGITWTQRTAPTTGSGRPVWKGLTFVPGTGFIGVAQAGATNTHQLITSPTGTTWTESDPLVPTVEPWIAIEYAPSLNTLVALANNTNNDGKSVMRLVVFATSITPATDLGGGGAALTITHADPVFRASGLYYCIFSSDPYAVGNPGVDYDPVLGFAPMGTPLSAFAAGTYVSDNEITCVAPPFYSTNGPVDVVVVDQNPTGLPIVGGHLINVPFYLPSGFSWLPPTITGIAPGHGGGAGGDAFTITGTNLYAGSPQFPNRIGFGAGAAVQVTYVDATTLTGVSDVYGGGPTTVDVSLIPPIFTYGGGRQAITTLVDAWTYDPVWWSFSGADGDLFTFLDPTRCIRISSDWQEFLAWFETYFGFPWEGFLPACMAGGDWTFKFIESGVGVPRLDPFTFTWWFYGFRAPGFGWTHVPLAVPDLNGWWSSVAGFRGNVLIVADSRPKNPRTWADFAFFASSSAAMLGGSPGLAAVIHNRLVYAASGYTVGTTPPPIRLFDGSYDRELTKVPPTSAGAVSKAIVSLLAANGTIYVSTIDSGTSSADFVGRVFALDIETATLRPIGAAFPAGHVPYALAWANGMLWCGTHRQVSTAVGKVYAIRPDVDAAWLEEYDLAASGVTGVAALVSFQGSLYVGTTAAAGTFAKILKRGADGSYTTAETGSGGTATANNGFLSLVEFHGVLYAGYWNADTPAVATIRKSADGTTWAASFTGATTTLRPFIALTVESGELFALGGGFGLTGALLNTLDGITWTNLTAQIPETTETALPAFGVVVL